MTHVVAVGDADASVLPVENSIAGAVAAAWQALIAESSLHVVGETTLPIHLCVLAPTGARLDEIRTVESHPVALAQCGRFFAAHPQLRAVAAWDTAGAAMEVARRADRSCAAIAGRGTVSRYALRILAENVEDSADNRTRFLVLARTPAPTPLATHSSRALVLVSSHHPVSANARRIFSSDEYAVLELRDPSASALGQLLSEAPSRLLGHYSTV